MTSDASKTIGHLGERYAAQHFERLGYRVVARNHRTRHGELDLVLADERALVFCEVKTRRRGSGQPFDSLHPAKREQVRRMALAFLAEVEARPRRTELRFDAVGVTVDDHGALVRLEHLQDAF